MLVARESGVDHLDVVAAVHEGTIGIDIDSNMWVAP